METRPWILQICCILVIDNLTSWELCHCWVCMWMCGCMGVWVCGCVGVCTCAYVHMCMCECVHICMCLFAHLCMYVYVLVFMCVSMCACVYMRMSACAESVRGNLQIVSGKYYTLSVRSSWSFIPDVQNHSSPSRFSSSHEALCLGNI